MKPTLLILAAGMGSRYGGLKQVDGVGPQGEPIIEYSVYDAIRAGFGKVVFVIRKDIEQAFREKFSNKFEDKVQVEYAFQAVNTPIEGITELPEREKPWGTAHAVLVARHLIEEPFAVINADDYYGISSFEDIARFLKNDCRPDHYAMIGYQLDKTLSEAGHVNRGICSVDANGLLTDVVERHRIHRSAAGIFYEENGEKHSLSEEALVSMNFWGLHPRVFDEIHRQFLRFVEDNKDNPKAEFYIPTVANQLIQSGKVKLSVLPNKEKWYGVTYREDKAMVEKAFEGLVEEGRYPGRLWG
ncbi:MAG: nucleotidyltransferase [Lewinellaceae bacterium]|nr:nucleotidyltransferase [Lewinellaceae bacterium]